MYCPRCGKKLKLLPKQDCPEVDWESMDDDLISRQLQIQADFEEIQRDEYECTGGCFQKDFPLYHHQPFQGINSAPGDSWSLSWVK